MQKRTTLPVWGTISILLFAGSCGATADARSSQAPPAQIAQERAQAELEVPRIVEVAGVTPSSVVADIGAGGGAITVVLGKFLTDGHIFSTDVSPSSLAEIRAYAQREHLNNVTVVEGAALSAQLPSSCCDVIIMRNVYHHLTEPAKFMATVSNALKPGARLAIIDFPARAGTPLPKGVPLNREGNGIRRLLVEEEVGASGLEHLESIDRWPVGRPQSRVYLVLFRKPLK